MPYDEMCLIIYGIYERIEISEGNVWFCNMDINEDDLDNHIIKAPNFTFAKRIYDEWVAVSFECVNFDEYNISICVNEDLCVVLTFVGWIVSNNSLELHDENIKHGLKGMSEAYKLIKFFIKYLLPCGFSLIVYGEGKKGRAYKFLERIGFEKQTKNVNKNISKYVFENKNF